MADSSVKKASILDFITKKVLFICLLTFTFSYFHQGGGFNQNATIGEIRELVENHTVEISKWLPITGDVSRYNGKTYSNKSPSLLFIVAPIYFCIYQGASLIGIDISSASYNLVATHLLTFMCSGIWAVFLGILYLKLIPYLFPYLSEDDCYWCAYFFTVGTLTFPYAGVAFVHNFETFCVLYVFYRLVLFQNLKSKRSMDVLALSCGFMMLANPITVLAMPIVYIVGWFQFNSPVFAKDTILRFIRFSIIAMVPLLPLFIYNQMVFDFFLSGNRNHQDPVWTDPNLWMGVFGPPQWERIANVFGWGHRSVFTIMPFLVMGFLGVFVKFRDQPALPHRYLAFPVGIFVTFLMMILTFNGWHGGTCLGPRYFMAALPFIALSSVPFFVRYRLFYVSLVCWSILVMMVASSGSIWVSQNDFHPLTSILNKFDGQTATEWPSFLGPSPPFNRYNLGHVMGFPGYWSLLPLAIAHVLGLAAIFRKKIGFFAKESYASQWTRGLRVLGGLVGALVLVRLADLNITPFINDEAHIQLRVSQILQGGGLPLVGLSGSQPIPYGPIPIWIYTLLRFVYDSHLMILWGHTLTHLLALWLFFKVQIRIFTPKIALLTTTFAASSPFLFNYARMPWDNTFLFLFSMGMVFFVSKIVDSKSHSNGNWFGLGFFSGCAIATHLMVVPLVVSSFAVSLIYSRQNLKEIIRKVGMSALGIGLITLPYFSAIMRLVFSTGLQGPPSAGKHWGGLAQWPTILEQFTRFVSFPGFISYFLRGNEAEVLQSLPRFLRLIDKIDGTWLLKLPILFVIAYPLGLALCLKRKDLRQLNPMLVYCSLTTGLVFTLYSYSGHLSHPHYYNYVWWIPMMALGFLMTSHWQIPSKLAVGLVTLGLGLNLWFTVRVGRYIVENEGIRGLGWGASARNQQRIVRELCQATKSQNPVAPAEGYKVKVDFSKVVILPHSLSYFSQKEPECHGVTLEFASQGEYSLEYAASDRPPRARLRYQKTPN